MATAKNIITGIIAEVPEHYLDHPILGADLVAYNGEETVAPKSEKPKAEVSAPATDK
jgi:hypothetical protein